MCNIFVVALVAAMSLTVAGTGTVFAMNNFHMHGENCEWVVDKAAYDEVVQHPEEGHYEKVEVSPEEGHFETVHHEAVYETVHHPAEYKTVHHPAEYDTIHHEEGHYEMVTRCTNCGYVITSDEDFVNHVKENFMNGCNGHASKEEWVVDKEAVYEDKWIVDKEAWEETIHHKEEGHWVCNGEPQEPEQKPEQPENPDQKPEQPENPDQKPEQPENPDVETPETPDAENPATPEQKPDANKENVQTQETETKKEGTSPKTGDTASALPVAGAGLASLGAVLATILKKRK